MTRTGWFIYNGFDTRSLGLTVVPGDIDSAPARNFLVHAHGGANGDFVVDTGRFDNVPRTYTIMIRGNFRATYDALCNALLPMKGYQRLTDMWAPDEYFMAYLSGPLEPTVSPDEDKGTVLVSFTRQPQRWLLSGEQPLAMRRLGNYFTSGYIQSPSLYEVCPEIHITLDASVIATQTQRDLVLAVLYLPNNGNSGNVTYTASRFVTVYDTQTQLTIAQLFNGVNTLVLDCANTTLYDASDPEKNFSQHLHVTKDTYYAPGRPQALPIDRFSLPVYPTEYSLQAWPTMVSCCGSNVDNYKVYARWYTV